MIQKLLHSKFIGGLIMKLGKLVKAVKDSQKYFELAHNHIFESSKVFTASLKGYNKKVKTLRPNRQVQLELFKK